MSKVPPTVTRRRSRLLATGPSAAAATGRRCGCSGGRLGGRRVTGGGAAGGSGQRAHLGLGRGAPRLLGRGRHGLGRDRGGHFGLTRVGERRSGVSRRPGLGRVGTSWREGNAPCPASLGADIHSESFGDCTAWVLPSGSRNHADEPSAGDLVPCRGLYRDQDELPIDIALRRRARRRFHRGDEFEEQSLRALLLGRHTPVQRMSPLRSAPWLRPCRARWRRPNAARRTGAPPGCRHRRRPARRRRSSAPAPDRRYAWARSRPGRRDRSARRSWCVRSAGSRRPARNPRRWTGSTLEEGAERQHGKAKEGDAGACPGARGRRARCCKQQRPARRRPTRWRPTASGRTANRRD